MKIGNDNTWPCLRSWLIRDFRACFFSIFLLVSAFSGFAVPVGSIIAYGTSSAPVGWLSCDGNYYSPEFYSELYAVIGYTYGIQYIEGQSNRFRVPDLRSRFPLGVSSGRGLAVTGGVETVTLTLNQMPAHHHDFAGTALGGNQSYPAKGGDGSIYGNADWTSTTGGGQPFTNMPPYQVVNYIIKYTTNYDALVSTNTVVDAVENLQVTMLWRLKTELWIMGGICALICALCFFARR